MCFLDIFSKENGFVCQVREEKVNGGPRSLSRTRHGTGDNFESPQLILGQCSRHNGPRWRNDNPQAKTRVSPISRQVWRKKATLRRWRRSRRCWRSKRTRWILREVFLLWEGSSSLFGKTLMIFSSSFSSAYFSLSLSSQENYIYLSISANLSFNQ